MSGIERARERAERDRVERERLLARVRCWLIRARLLVTGIEEVGVLLSRGPVTVLGAYNALADLAVDADELAAGLAEGEEVLPDLVEAS
jgi:hypothetical protein